MDDILMMIPEMKTGEALKESLGIYPSYEESIRNGGTRERLMALSSVYDVYVPGRMSAEIYHKLYMAVIRSLQKKGTIQAVRQQSENGKGVRGKELQGILGGSDSFTIIGKSGIGKSSAISRAIHLITEGKVLETEHPYQKIAACISVQCPFDASVKGLMLEILRRIDECLDSHYYKNAVKARATTDMLIGAVSQAALNHIGLLVVDEIQNVANSKNGKNLIGSLTQLINSSGISVCMVGTPDSVPFFEQAMQLARRSLGLQYGVMGFREEFFEVCRVLFRYQYVREKAELTDAVLEWLYEHCGGNVSVLVSLIHDAQELSILDGRERLDIQALEKAYAERLAMLHPYLESDVRKKKQCSESRKKRDLKKMVKDNRSGDILEGQKGYADVVAEAKERKGELLTVLRQSFSVEEVEV